MNPSPSRMSLDQITIPGELGSIEGTFRGNGKKTVVLIQDAHAIPDAQRSIKLLIEYFERQYGINLIALEGASSALDPQIFRSFPDQKILTKVFEKYMQAGELAGGPAAAIFSASKTADPSFGGSDRNALYYGIEDWDLYEQGIRRYLEAMSVEGQVMDKISALKTRLQDQKKKVYSKELLQLDQSLEEFYENHVNLPEILKQLAVIKAPQADSELAVLLEESNRQGDEDSLSTEVSRFAEHIHRHLKKNAFSKEARDTLMEFNQKHQDFSTSRLTPQAFALYLKKVAADYQIPVRVSKALHSRTQKQQKLENIKGTKLFDDFERYVNEVKSSLLKTGEAKALNELSGQLRLIETFARLELSHVQWERITSVIARERSDRSNLGIEIATRPSGARDDEKWIEVLQMLEPHFKFYQLANARDEKFLKNLERLMQKEKTDRLVMVSGGFHARNMARMFQDNGISYVLLTPQINSIPDEIPYRKQMQGDVSWKDYFEIENGKINLYIAFVRAARDRLVAYSGERIADRTNPKRYTLNAPRYLLKSWRDQIIRDLADQNRIADSSRYTRFIDEVAGHAPPDAPGEKLIREAEKFADGLRRLHSSGKLTQDNILQLLRSPSALHAASATVSSVNFLIDRGLPAEIVTPAAREEPRFTSSGSGRAPMQLGNVQQTETDKSAEVRSEVRTAISRELLMERLNALQADGRLEDTAEKWIKGSMYGIRLTSGLTKKIIAVQRAKASPNRIAVALRWSFLWVVDWIERLMGRGPRLPAVVRLVELAGMVDRAKYSEQYWSDNIGSVFGIQVGTKTYDDGRTEDVVDIYPVKKTTLEKQYKPEKADTGGALIENPQLSGLENFTEFSYLKSHFELEGVLSKGEERLMVRTTALLSEEGLENKLDIVQPVSWGKGYQTKPAGREGWIVVTIGDDGSMQEDSYLVNSNRDNEPLNYRRSEVRQAEDWIPAELEVLTVQISEAKRQGNEVVAKKLEEKRVNLAVEYAWAKIGNPFIAHSVEVAIIRNQNPTDTQHEILTGGKRAKDKIAGIKDIADFARQDLATSWIEGPDRRMRHGADEARALEEQVLRRFSKFFSKDEQAVLNDKTQWRGEEKSTGQRSAHSESWRAVDHVEPVIAQASNMEAALKILLQYLANQVGLKEGEKEITQRVKGVNSTRNKIQKFRETWGANATIADVFDLLGGRIVVADLDALERVMEAIDQFFGFEIAVNEQGLHVVSEASDVLRKENKFLTARPGDPYRAIQYTIRFPSRDKLKELIRKAGIHLKIPDEDLSRVLANIDLVDDTALHTFELQVKTAPGSTASDIYHDAVYKDLLQLPLELKQIIDDYNWNSFWEDIAAYARTKDIEFESPVFSPDPAAEKADELTARLLDRLIESRRVEAQNRESHHSELYQAVREGNFSHFADLALSYYAGEVDLPEELHGLLNLIGYQVIENFLKLQAVPEAERGKYRTAITKAINNLDMNRFYDLVLSAYNPKETFKTELAKIFFLFTSQATDKLKRVKAEDENRQKEMLGYQSRTAPLEEAGNRGYLKMVAAEGLKPTGDQLGHELNETAIDLLARRTQNGHENYSRRYDNFPVRGNKLSVEDLGLHQLSDDDLISFFEASGKRFDFDRVNRLSAQITAPGFDQDTAKFLKNSGASKIEQLLVKIKLYREDTPENRKKREDLLVMNLFHASRKEQYEAVQFFTDENAAKKWVDRLATNQLGAVTITSLLSMMTYDAVRDIDGNVVMVTNAQGEEEPLMRDLGRTVVTNDSGENFTLREMLIFLNFISAISPQHEFARLSYEEFVTSSASEWARSFDIAIDREVLDTLVTGQLDLLRNRIAESTNPMHLVRDLDIRRELLDSYFRSVLKDREAIEAVMAYINGKYNHDISALVRSGGGSPEVQRRVTQAAKGSIQTDVFVGKTETGKLVSTILDRADFSPEDLTVIGQIFDGRSEMRSLENVKAVAGRLEVVRKIQSDLAEKGIAFVFGAPGSGKSEQLGIAVRGARPFDFRNEFYERNQAPQGVAWADFNSRYKEDPELKSVEQEWFAESFKQISAEMKQWPEEVVVIDEFDLALGETLNQAETETAKRVVDLAADLISAGKKVVLVLHSKGLRSDDVTRHAESKLLAPSMSLESEVIHTGYFSREIEKDLLGLVNITGDTAERFTKLARGLPAAYLGLLEHMSDSLQRGELEEARLPSFVELVAQAQARIEKNYNVAKITSASDVVEMLRDLASGKASLEDNKILGNRARLLDTGLVGERVEIIDGESKSILVMAPLVRDVINYIEARAKVAGLPAAYEGEHDYTERTPNFHIDYHHEGGRDGRLKHHLMAIFGAMRQLTGRQRVPAVPEIAQDYVRQAHADNPAMLEAFIMVHDVGKADTFKPKASRSDGYSYQGHEARPAQILSDHVIFYGDLNASQSPLLKFIIQNHTKAFDIRNADDLLKSLKAEFDEMGVAAETGFHSAIEFLIATTTLDLMGSQLDDQGNFGQMAIVGYLIEVLKRYKEDQFRSEVRVEKDQTEKASLLAELEKMGIDTKRIREHVFQGPDKGFVDLPPLVNSSVEGIRDYLKWTQKLRSEARKMEQSELATNLSALKQQEGVVKSYKPLAKLGFRFDPSQTSVAEIQRFFVELSSALGTEVGELDRAAYSAETIQKYIDEAKSRNTSVVVAVQPAAGKPEAYFPSPKTIGRDFDQVGAETAVSDNAGLSALRDSDARVQNLLTQGSLSDVSVDGFIAKAVTVRQMVKVSDFVSDPAERAGFTIQAPLSWGDPSATQAIQAGRDDAFIVIEGDEGYMVQMEADGTPVNYQQARAEMRQKKEGEAARARPEPLDKARGKQSRRAEMRAADGASKEEGTAPNAGVREQLRREGSATREEFIFRYGRLPADHPAAQYVQRLFQEALGEESDAYELVILPGWKETNAIALPNGTILVSLGLLKFVKYREELKAVLAHEVMHIKKRHPEIRERIRSEEERLQEGFLNRIAGELGVRRLQESEADLGWILEEFGKRDINPLGQVVFFERLDIEDKKDPERRAKSWIHGGLEDRALNTESIFYVLDLASLSQELGAIPEEFMRQVGSLYKEHRMADFWGMSQPTDTIEAIQENHAKRLRAVSAILPEHLPLAYQTASRRVGRQDARFRLLEQEYREKMEWWVFRPKKEKKHDRIEKARMILDHETAVLNEIKERIAGDVFPETRWNDPRVRSFATALYKAFWLERPKTIDLSIKGFDDAERVIQVLTQPDFRNLTTLPIPVPPDELTRGFLSELIKAEHLNEAPTQEKVGRYISLASLWFERITELYEECGLKSVRAGPMIEKFLGELYFKVLAQFPELRSWAREHVQTYPLFRAHQEEENKIQVAAEDRTETETPREQVSIEAVDSIVKKLWNESKINKKFALTKFHDVWNEINQVVQGKDMKSAVGFFFQIFEGLEARRVFRKEKILQRVEETYDTEDEDENAQELTELLLSISQYLLYRLFAHAVTNLHQFQSLTGEEKKMLILQGLFRFVPSLGLYDRIGLPTDIRYGKGLRFTIDETGKLALEDYDQFGDPVILDTTYHSDKSIYDFGDPAVTHPDERDYIETLFNTIEENWLEPKRTRQEIVDFYRFTVESKFGAGLTFLRMNTAATDDIFFKSFAAYLARFTAFDGFFNELRELEKLGLPAARIIRDNRNLFGAPLAALWDSLPEKPNREQLASIHEAVDFVEDPFLRLQLLSYYYQSAWPALSFEERLDELFSKSSEGLFDLARFSDFVESEAQTEAELKKVNDSFRRNLDHFLTTPARWKGVVAALSNISLGADFAHDLSISLLKTHESDESLKALMYSHIDYALSSERHAQTDEGHIWRVNRLIELSEKSENVFLRMDTSAKLILLRRLLTGDQGLIANPASRVKFLKALTESSIRQADENGLMTVIRDVIGAAGESKTWKPLYFALQSFLAERIGVPPERLSGWERVIADALQGLEKDIGARWSGRGKMSFGELSQVISSMMETSWRAERLFLDYSEELLRRKLRERAVKEAEPPRSKLSPLSFVIELAQKTGALGVRFLQILPQFVDLPEQYQGEFSKVYDSVYGQSKLAAVAVLEREWPGFWNEVSEVTERVGGGSLMTVYRIKTKDGKDQVVKVLNPNLEYHLDTNSAFVQEILDRLVKQSAGTYQFAPHVLNEVKKWISKDVRFEHFLEKDRAFRKTNDGFTSNGSHYRILVPQSLGPPSRYFMREEYVEGSNLTQWNDLEAAGRDLRDIVGLIAKNYVHQIRNGLIHSDVHVGNFRVTPDQKVAILDRNFYLELPPKAKELVEVMLNPLKLTTISSERLTEMLAGLSETPISAEAREKLAQTLRETLDNIRKGEWKSIGTLLVELRKNGLRLPLELTLIFKNLNSLQQMSRRAGFESVLEAYLYVPDTLGASGEDADSRAEMRSSAPKPLTSIKQVRAGDHVHHQMHGVGVVISKSGSVVDIRFSTAFRHFTDISFATHKEFRRATAREIQDFNQAAVAAKARYGAEMSRAKKAVRDGKAVLRKNSQGGVLYGFPGASPIHTIVTGPPNLIALQVDDLGKMTASLWSTIHEREAGHVNLRTATNVERVMIIAIARLTGSPYFQAPGAFKIKLAEEGVETIRQSFDGENLTEEAKQRAREAARRHTRFARLDQKELNIAIEASLPNVEVILLDFLRSIDSKDQGLVAARAEVRTETRLGLGEEQEVLIPRDPGGAEVIQDDKDGNSAVTRNDNGTSDSRLGVNHVVSLVSNGLKTGELKDPAQRSIGNRDNAIQGSGGLERNFTVFGGNQRRSRPTVSAGILGDKTVLLQDFPEGAHPAGFFQKEPHSVLKHPASVFNRIPAARDRKFGTQADERQSLFENNGSKLDFLHDDQTIPRAIERVKPSLPARAEMRDGEGLGQAKSIGHRAQGGAMLSALSSMQAEGVTPRAEMRNGEQLEVGSLKLDEAIRAEGVTPRAEMRTERDLLGFRDFPDRPYDLRKIAVLPAEGYYSIGSGGRSVFVGDQVIYEAERLVLIMDALIELNREFFRTDERLLQALNHYLLLYQSRLWPRKKGVDYQNLDERFARLEEILGKRIARQLDEIWGQIRHAEQLDSYNARQPGNPDFPLTPDSGFDLVVTIGEGTDRERSLIVPRTREMDIPELKTFLEHTVQLMRGANAADSGLDEASRAELWMDSNATRAGFVVGGVNSNGTIDQLTELAGVSIEEIERRARPHAEGYWRSGLMSDRDRLKEILKADNAIVQSQGFTHEQLAQFLFHVMDQVKKKIEEVGYGKFYSVDFEFQGRKYQAKRPHDWMEHFKSIFNDGLTGGSSVYQVTNLDTNSTVFFYDMIPHYIRRYGFYGGRTTNRIEPLDVIDLLNPREDDPIRQARAGRKAVLNSAHDIRKLLSFFEFDELKPLLQNLAIHVTDLPAFVAYLKLLRKWSEFSNQIREKTTVDLAPFTLRDSYDRFLFRTAYWGLRGDYNDAYTSDYAERADPHVKAQMVERMSGIQVSADDSLDINQNPAGIYDVPVGYFVNMLAIPYDSEKGDYELDQKFLSKVQPRDPNRPEDVQVTDQLVREVEAQAARAEVRALAGEAGAAEPGFELRSPSLAEIEAALKAVRSSDRFAFMIVPDQVRGRHVVLIAKPRQLILSDTENRLTVKFSEFMNPPQAAVEWERFITLRARQSGISIETLLERVKTGIGPVFINPPDLSNDPLVIGDRYVVEFMSEAPFPPEFDQGVQAGATEVESTAPSILPDAISEGDLQSLINAKRNGSFVLLKVINSTGAVSWIVTKIAFLTDMRPHGVLVGFSEMQTSLKGETEITLKARSKIAEDPDSEAHLYQGTPSIMVYPYDIRVLSVTHLTAPEGRRRAEVRQASPELLKVLGVSPKRLERVLYEDRKILVNQMVERLSDRRNAGWIPEAREFARRYQPRSEGQLVVTSDLNPIPYLALLLAQEVLPHKQVVEAEARFKGRRGSLALLGAFLASPAGFSMAKETMKKGGGLTDAQVMALLRKVAQEDTAEMELKIPDLLREARKRWDTVSPDPLRISDTVPDKTMKLEDPAQERQRELAHLRTLKRILEKAFDGISGDAIDYYDLDRRIGELQEGESEERLDRSVALTEQTGAQVTRFKARSTPARAEVREEVPFRQRKSELDRAIELLVPRFVLDEHVTDGEVAAAVSGFKKSIYPSRWRFVFQAGWLNYLLNTRFGPVGFFASALLMTYLAMRFPGQAETVMMNALPVVGIYLIVRAIAAHFEKPRGSEIKSYVVPNGRMMILVGDGLSAEKAVYLAASFLPPFSDRFEELPHSLATFLWLLKAEHSFNRETLERLYLAGDDEEYQVPSREYPFHMGVLLTRTDPTEDSDFLNRISEAAESFGGLSYEDDLTDVWTSAVGDYLISQGRPLSGHMRIFAAVLAGFAYGRSRQIAQDPARAFELAPRFLKYLALARARGNVSERGILGQLRGAFNRQYGESRAEVREEEGRGSKAEGGRGLPSTVDLQAPTLDQDESVRAEVRGGKNLQPQFKEGVPSEIKRILNQATWLSDSTELTVIYWDGELQLDRLHDYGVDLANNDLITYLADTPQTVSRLKTDEALKQIVGRLPEAPLYKVAAFYDATHNKRILFIAKQDSLVLKEFTIQSGEPEKQMTFDRIIIDLQNKVVTLEFKEIYAGWEIRTSTRYTRLVVNAAGRVSLFEGNPTFALQAYAPPAIEWKWKESNSSLSRRDLERLSRAMEEISSRYDYGPDNSIFGWLAPVAQQLDAAGETVMTYDQIDERIEDIPQSERPGVSFHFIGPAAGREGHGDLTIDAKGRRFHVSLITHLTAFGGQLYVRYLDGRKSFSPIVVKISGALTPYRSVDLEIEKPPLSEGVEQIREDELPPEVKKEFGSGPRSGKDRDPLYAIVSAFNESVAGKVGTDDYSELPFRAYLKPGDVVKLRTTLPADLPFRNEPVSKEAEISGLVELRYLPEVQGLSGSPTRSYPAAFVRHADEMGKMKSEIVYRNAGRNSVPEDNELAREALDRAAAQLRQQGLSFNPADEPQHPFYLNPSTGAVYSFATPILETFPLDETKTVVVTGAQVSITRDSIGTITIQSGSHTLDPLRN